MTISKIAERFSYGCGDFGCNIIYTAMSAFLLFYYTDYAGVSAAAVGTIMLVSRIFDGVSDIIMGGDCGQDEIQVRESETMASADVRTVCHLWRAAVFSSRKLGFHTEAGLCIYYI